MSKFILTCTRFFTLWILLMVCSMTGSIMNQIVAHDNGGKMPVVCYTKSACDMTDDNVHTPLTRNTHDKVLADIIPLPNIYGELDGVESIGDVLVFVGWAGQPFLFLKFIGFVLYSIFKGLSKLFRRPVW
jgi:hypothetical protein